MDRFPIYCGLDALGRLAQFCRERQYDRFLLVADSNTYPALGRSVERTLGEFGWDVRTVLLEGVEISADEKRIFEVLHKANGEEWLYLAVGSGTITDITRYASFCAKNPFVSLPTAPSVDAYASGGAALVMSGYKRTISCQAPIAVFADLPTLCEAPYALVAAGFGDMIGKFTSLADWRLGALLLDEPFDDGIWERSRRALSRCVAGAQEIAHRSHSGIEILMDSLLESGLCMMDFGGSRPASGAEHLFSHYWDITHERTGQPPALHGAQVGVGTVLAAQLYEAVRGVAHVAVAERLEATRLPSAGTEVDQIGRVFGALADPIIANHRRFLQEMEANRAEMVHRITGRWAEIQRVAAAVPNAKDIASQLTAVGAASDAQEIGLTQDDVRDALCDARYLRARFTVDTLGRLLGLW